MTLPSPYPGLRPFQQAEADLFFGREAQIEDMLARLEDRRFLAVVGTSGCGKSSLVRAGLLPALEQGFLSDAKPHWRMAVMSPGSAPFDNLTTALLGDAALGRDRQHASQAAALLQATLRRGPRGLVEAVAESYLPEGTNLLLVVDQFEEIFRYRKQTQNVNDADAFVSLLLASAQSQQSDVPVYVVITMRSDFLGDCALFIGLPEAINDSQFLTPRLMREQYRSAIVEPALVAGGQLTDALLNRLLNDLRGEPDQLPVLQHALMRMWTQASNAPERALTLDDYKAVGGLAGALSKHCDEILADLNPDQQRIAQVMCRALCERSAEQRDTRRPVRLGEVAAIAEVEVAAVKPVVDAFRDTGRHFLMPSLPTPLDAETMLDISHESLIRQWQTLNTWVVAEAESARQYQRLEDAAKRRQQRGGAELWHGVDLENARNWKEQEKPNAAWAARYGDAYQLAMDFLQASEAEEEKRQREYEHAHQRELEQARERAEFQRIRAEEQARAARRFKITTVAVGVLLLFTIGFAIHAVRQQSRAAAAQKSAENAQREIEEKKQEAELVAEEAKRQRQIALVHLARYFSALSHTLTERRPTLSILLSIEAKKAALIPAAEEALRNAITKIASIALVGHQGGVRGMMFSPDGQVLATGSDDKTVRLWSLSNPTAEPRVLRGHEEAVGGMMFSPDGQVLATGSDDKTVRLWSLSNPTAEPRVLRGHEEAVRGVVFSPDGQVLATGSADKTVRLWSPSNPTAEPRVLRGHEEAVGGVVFSPDGQVLATGSDDKTVRLWSLSNPTAEPRVLRGHEGAVWGMRFSPDGQVLATGSDDKTVRLWSLSNPTAEPRVLRGHERAVWGMRFSPDGQVLATGSDDKTVRLWSLSNPTAEPRVLRGHEGAVWGVVFSPDGQVLATGSDDKTVRLWSLSNPTAEPRVLRGHEGAVRGVVFSPDGQVLATRSADETVRLWSLSNPTAEPRVLRGHEEAVWGVVFSPDGQVLATGSDDKTVRLWSLSNPTAEPRVLRGHEGAVGGVVFSPDGQVLATRSADKTVRLWSPSNPTAEPRVLRGHEDWVGEAVFSPDGQVLATGSDDKTVRLWSLSNPTAEPRVLRDHEEAVRGVVFSPDGQVLATGSDDKTVRLWSLGNPTAEPRVLRGHERAVWGVVFSPDGQVLATRSADKTVRLWSPSNPTAEPRVLRGHEGAVRGVVFSPDGQVLATGSDDKTVRLWSLSNPTAEPRVLRGHEGAVWGVVFNPDGQVLATRSADKTVRLWSLSNPTAEPRVLRDHEGAVGGAVFSPDGQVLATGSEDKTVRLWSPAIDYLVQMGCLSTGGNFSYTEWQQHMGDEPYHKTCQNRPLHPSFLEDIRRQVKGGDVEGAVEKLLKALKVEGVSDVDLQKEAWRLVAPGLVDKGRELAKQGAIREAMTAFATAQANDPTLEIAAAPWNTLCWFGSLGGFATDVMAACERAVALKPDHGGIYESRGVARALTGDYPGAIQDFQQYLEWGLKNGTPKERIHQRQDWIRMLQANQNPFNEELLKLLRE